MKRTGAAVIPMLTGVGIPLETAKTLVAPNGPKIFLSVPANVNVIGSSDENWTYVISAYNHIKSLLGRDMQILHNNGEDEQFILGAWVSPEDIPKILNKIIINNSDIDEGIYYELRMPNMSGVPNITLSSSDSPEWMDVDEFSKVGNLLKDWWDNWENFSPNIMSDSLFNKLRKNNIDPTDRIDEVKDQIKYNAETDPEYGNLEKYGIEPKEPEELEYYNTPDDYKYASSMHQPFEQRYFNHRFNMILEKL